MRQNTLETLLGAVIIIGAIIFAFTVYDSANLTPSDGMELKAEFGDVSGLSVGDDVFLAGIKIGQVTSYEIDKITYVARLSFRITPDIQLPSDTGARIVAKSLLGGYVLELSPGAEESMLQAGDIIYDTIDATSLTDLLGKFIFQSANE
ncbi:MAG: MCE family protein [Alphaproteobacteria bacterium]|jgi:phospholipid/cholesterol/gamma-HCH transport system substrate-binding protein|nr:MCE family protein [Alphaproteobacteria bacterium]MBT5798274.1 MCE family protein [Alphaproteobacteria bacterium]